MEVRFVAYYSTAGNNIGAQSRVSTNVVNGVPQWKACAKFEVMRNGFLECDLLTADMDFVSDNRKESGLCAGWVETRELGSSVIEMSCVIELIQTFTIGNKNKIAMRLRPGTSFIVN